MISVAVCIIWNHKGELLLAQKSDGTWEFPGGKQEEEEDLFGCARREILEELAISIHPFRIEKPELRVDSSKGPYLLRLISCRYLGGDIILHEHLSSKWLKPLAVQQHELHASDAALWLMFLENQQIRVENGD